MRKGGGRNERKANAKRVTESLRREKELRELRDRLRQLPVNQRSREYALELRRIEGKLKRAIGARRKSETHSMRDKGGA